jgi:hypothetical protein
MADPTVYNMDELATVQKTKGGIPVTNNYIQTSIGHLKELYTKTDDLVNAGNMDELLARVQTEGLTKKEVNDIARTYNVEFGNKAFGPMDTPLTSVNAQTYRNVQQGLKEVARRGLSDAAKELDSTISSLYNTKRLIDQNARAATLLRQKFDQRGIVEKLGRHIVSAMDLATGGLLKGMTKALLPRSVGYKIMNAVDLEEKLARNLKIINAEIKRVEKMKSPGPSELKQRIGLTSKPELAFGEQIPERPTF